MTNKTKINLILKQKGFALPLVISVIFIVLGLGFINYKLSRSSYRQVVHSLDSETGYHFAHGIYSITKSKVELAIEYINSNDPDTFPKRDSAPDEIKEIIQFFLKINGLPDSSENSLIVLPKVYSSFLNYTNGGEVSVKIIKTAIKQIGIINDTVITKDTSEFDFILKIIVETKLANRKLSNSKQKIKAFTFVKSINILPGIVSKFVLFVKSAASEDLNFNEASNGSSNSSMIVFSGKGLNITDADATIVKIPSFIDNQGWIYFGDNTLNIGLASSSEESLFSDRLFGIRPSGLNYPILNISSLSYCFQTEEHKLEHKGADYNYALSLVPTSDLNLSSKIVLYGSSLVPNPTVILGNVYRKFSLLQGLYNDDIDQISWLPYVSDGVFNSGDQFPNISLSLTNQLKLYFGNSYDEYRRFSSQIFQEPINQSILEMISKYKTLSQFRSSPSLVNENYKSAHLKRLSSGGLEIPLLGVIDFPHYTIRNDLNNILFDKVILPDISKLEEVYLKIGMEYDSWLEFLDQNHSSTDINIQGVVQINGDINIETPITFKSGGILISSGNIKINKQILVQDNKPLSLISTNGNITVQTKDEIWAALIALQGEVILNNEFNINGLIACNKLNTSSFIKETGEKKLIYNNAFDITNHSNKNRSYKFIENKKWKFFN